MLSENKIETRGGLQTNLSPLLNRWLPGALIILILGIYSYPTLKTTASTGSRALPPSFAPDSSLYLNISAIKSASPGQFLDPYYGVTIPSVRMGYLKFRLAFLLFAALNAILAGHLWWTALLWNLFWWTLLSLVGWWFFRQCCPDRSPLLALTGMAVLLLFNSGVLQSELAAWIHLPSLRGFRGIELPDIRPFFPQTPLPLLVLYLGLQIKALQSRRWHPWAAMAVVQFLGFAIFPYVTLLMMAITFAIVVAGIFSPQARAAWKIIAAYGLACGVIDLLFLLHGGQADRSGAPGENSLLHFQWSLFARHVGGMWLILAALTLAVFFVRDLAPAIKAPLIGLALGNLFLLVGDIFFSPAALQLSSHGGYFVHTTATILVITLISVASARFARGSKNWDYAFAATILFVLLNGLLIAHAAYQSFLPANQEQADLARALQAAAPADHDLVISRALLVDDNCAWTPLASASHALFCRNAQVLFTPEQNQSIQRFRHALYLYFTGKDTSWVEHVLTDSRAQVDLSRLMFLGQEDTEAAERKQALDEIRSDLIPALRNAENQGSEAKAFFSAYRRVFVIDSAATPSFDSSRLARYLRVEEQQHISGSLIVSRCVPAQP